LATVGGGGYAAKGYIDSRTEKQAADAISRGLKSLQSSKPQGDEEPVTYPTSPNPDAKKSEPDVKMVEDENPDSSTKVGTDSNPENLPFYIKQQAHMLKQGGTAIKPPADYRGTATEYMNEYNNSQLQDPNSPLSKALIRHQMGLQKGYNRNVDDTTANESDLEMWGGRDSAENNTYKMWKRGLLRDYQLPDRLLGKGMRVMSPKEADLLNDTDAATTGPAYGRGVPVYEPTNNGPLDLKSPYHTVDTVIENARLGSKLAPAGIPQMETRTINLNREGGMADGGTIRNIEKPVLGGDAKNPLATALSAKQNADEFKEESLREYMQTPAFLESLQNMQDFKENENNLRNFIPVTGEGPTDLDVASAQATDMNARLGLGEFATGSGVRPPEPEPEGGMGSVGPEGQQGEDGGYTGSEDETYPSPYVKPRNDPPEPQDDNTPTWAEVDQWHANERALIQEEKRRQRDGNFFTGIRDNLVNMGADVADGDHEQALADAAGVFLGGRGAQVDANYLGLGGQLLSGVAGKTANKFGSKNTLWQNARQAMGSEKTTGINWNGLQKEWQAAQKASQAAGRGVVRSGLAAGKAAVGGTIKRAMPYYTLGEGLYEGGKEAIMGGERSKRTGNRFLGTAEAIGNSLLAGGYDAVRANFDPEFQKATGAQTDPLGTGALIEWLYNRTIGDKVNSDSQKREQLRQQYKQKAR